MTQPDRRRGRGGRVRPSPVREAAADLGLPVVTPARGREAVEPVRAAGADAGVVVAFGQILPAPLLEAAPLGFVNVHFSLLPRWRGAAPVERAILAGDRETGVCTMRVVPELDAGPVYRCSRTPIGPDDTAGDLHARLVELSVPLLLATLDDLGRVEPEPQAGEPTYAEKLTVEEFRLDPGSPAARLHRLVRAGNPRPGAWLTVDGRRLKVWRARVDGDRFVPETVQPEGGRPMDYAAWRAGHGAADPFGRAVEAAGADGGPRPRGLAGRGDASR